MTRLRILARFGHQVAIVFLVTVALNYIWEIAQAPLYAGSDQWGSVWWHCFIASLGDGILVWIIVAIGWAVFRRVDWYRYPTGKTYGLMLLTGLCIGLGVEWVALHVLDRWSYDSRMPLIPILGIGLVPVLQMVVLPPLIFRFASKWSVEENEKQ